MAVPTVVGTGADNNSTTADVTYALPAHQSGDILILVTETNSTGGTSLTAGTVSAGWADITNSPRAQGSNVTCLNVYWLRADSASETDPVVSGAVNHQVGFTFAVRGCVASGDPWDFAPVGSGNASGSNMNATGDDTTVTDTLIICASANQTDTATDNYTTLANTTLSDEAFLNQAFTTDGNGGGCMVATGSRATAGATGTFTATITTAGATANLVFALKPATSTLVTGAAVGSFGFTGTAAGVPTTFGVAAGSLGFTATALGIDRVLGAAVSALGFTATSAGIDRALGQGVGSFGFTATALGVPTTSGAAAAVFGFTGTAAGIPRVVGVATALLGFTGTAAGTTGTVVTGAAVASFGFTGTANGVDRALGAALASLGFTGAALGVDRATGTATATFGFTGSAAGIPRVLGAAVTFGFTATASGIDRVVGVAVATLGFTGSANGIDPATLADVYAVRFTITETGHTFAIQEAAVIAMTEQAAFAVQEQG